MTTIRIYVEHDGPLDGASPLHPEATSAWNADLGLKEVWVPAGVPLGRLQLGTLAPGSEHWVEHLTVISACGTHAPGAFVGLAGPELGEVTPDPAPTIPLVDLGGFETNTGVLTEGLSVPIPPEHALVLDTRANGSRPGPHLIQITLGPPPRFLQDSLPTLQPMPGPDGPPPPDALPPDDGPAKGEPAKDESTQTISKERIAVSLAMSLPEEPETDEESSS